MHKQIYANVFDSQTGELLNKEPKILKFDGTYYNSSSIKYGTSIGASGVNIIPEVSIHQDNIEKEIITYTQTIIYSSPNKNRVIYWSNLKKEEYEHGKIINNGNGRVRW